MNYQSILVSQEESHLLVRLNRPHRMNAFTVAMCHELIDAIENASSDDTVNAVIVTGSGDAFCAGMDLKDYGDTFGLDRSIDMDGPHAEKNRDLGGLLALSIYNCAKPVIAAINGTAVGIGATMTLPMDFRLAANSARIGFVFSRIGIMPEAASNWFLPRIVGISKALEWAYSGDVFDASEALESGLVSQITEPQELLDAAFSICRKISKHSAPVSRAVIRKTMWRMLGASHPMTAHNIETRAIVELSGLDGAEGVSAFLEKRPAEFRAKPSTDLPAGFPWLEDPVFDPLARRKPTK